MDKVTGCAKLYSEFGIYVSRYAGRYLKEIYYKIHRAKVVLSPCSVSIKVF